MSNKKPPGNIHKIREFELEKIILSDEFDILQIVGEGWFGKILLVEHRATDTEMVLKALPKPYVSLRDFYREFHYGLHLGLHKNIVTTYDVAFETAGFYIFTQEYAPLGDLTSNVSDSGIGELHSKKVAKQVASALDYMHSKEIVHRDVKLDNVLIYKSDFSRVKLCDFGESYKSGSVVERRNEWLPYSPPEVLQIKPEETYIALPSHDVWQFAIVIFVCLTGCLPWQKAQSDDPRYVRYLAWQGFNMMSPFRRTPKLFKLLTSKAARMFRKFLEPRADRRPKNLSELSRFLDDRWLSKGAEKDMAEYEPDELCPSMYSFHSSPEEKNRVLWSLAEQGIETTVDRKAKKNRIKDWIESSVIMEDEEEEDSGSASASPSSSVSREPVPGHISAVRAEVAAIEAKDQKINTTIKDAANKHFDPRTGRIQQGPSEMGTINRQNSLLNLSNSTINTSNSNSLNNSVIALGSRNNLIMSEGNPYQNEMALDYNDDDEDDTEVNARVMSARLKETAKLNRIMHEQQKYKDTPPNNLKLLSVFNVSDSNLTTNQIGRSNNINNTNSNNNSKRKIQRTKSDSLKQILLFNSNNKSSNNDNNNNNNKKYASSTAINLINNNLSYNNSNNNNVPKIGLLSAFKSIATISVPEYNKTATTTNTTKQVQTTKNPKEEKSKQSTGESNGLRNTNKNLIDIGTSTSSINQAEYNKFNKPQEKNKDTSGTTMKDTAYDRVKFFSRKY